jgi:hypothetical protein
MTSGTSEDTQETYDPKTTYRADPGALRRKFDGKRSGGSSRHGQQHSGRLCACRSSAAPGRPGSGSSRRRDRTASRARLRPTR